MTADTNGHVGPGDGGIAVDDLTKTLRGTPILRGLDLTVEPASIAVIEGANGAGKTTLIRILSTVVAPDGGRVRVHGCDVARQPREVRGSIGVTFVNDRSLYWRIDGVRNLVLFGRLAGLSRRVVADRIPRLLADLHLEGVARERVSRMSTGQRQRLMLARALLNDPPVLLLDEPFRGLDDDGLQATIELLVQRARAGTTVLVVAPLIADVVSVADASYRLDGGVLRPLRDEAPAAMDPP